jgi:hypothetical protein
MAIYLNEQATWDLYVGIFSVSQTFSGDKKNRFWTVIPAL